MIARSRSRVSPATEGSIYWLSESRQRRPSDGDENSQEGGKTGKIWDGAGAILGIPHAGTDAHRRHPVCRKRARPSLASRMPERSHAKRRGGVRLREPRCTATSGPRGSGWGANGGSSAPPIPITVIPVAATEPSQRRGGVRLRSSLRLQIKCERTPKRNPPARCRSLPPCRVPDNMNP
jgi:hypothetical protein